MGEAAASAWLRCRLDMGMFSDEVAVTYPPVESRWQKSVFVPRACVRSDGEHEGAVKVNVVVKNGARFAVLPSSQRDIVKIEDADLQQRP
jgi:hypothetical protein